MGRFVSVHPLGVIVAVAAGVLVAGIPGALVAVPLTASINAVVQDLAGFSQMGDDAGQGRDRTTPVDQPQGTSRGPGPAAGPRVAP
jgi:predicted PurR-regulated permease PerM